MNSRAAYRTDNKEIRMFVSRRADEEAKMLAPQIAQETVKLPVPPIINSDCDGVKEGTLLDEELKFYQSYEWCLNPYVTVREAIGHLGEEIDKLSALPDGWQSAEVVTNILLLSSGVLNCVDEYLRETILRLPERLAATLPGRAAGRLVEIGSERPWVRSRLARWRRQWLSELDAFLSLVVRERAAVSALAPAATGLKGLLAFALPADLLAERLGTPIAFNRIDLTHKDYLSLGQSYIRRFPERTCKILLLGLRTSGSYFAPLLKAFFQAAGYPNVALLTVEPNKGAGRREHKELERFAASGYRALIVDDAPFSSSTAFAAFNIALRAGFAADNVKFLVPTHALTSNWFNALPDESVITLPPERWHKYQLLNADAVTHRLAEYFCGQGFARATLTESRRVDEFNASLQGTASHERGMRLKRVYEVQLETPEGERQTKYVLAKCVGWGWFGYHSFLIGRRLSGYVPSLLGLRDGILYMEWVPQPAVAWGDRRHELVERSAAYVAARACRLKLDRSAVGMNLKKHDNSSQLLGTALSGAYGSGAGKFMRSRLAELFRQRPCPFPTHIDGNMHPSEWVLGRRGPLKIDYEHHGMGRAALNVVDPAYDLADTILHLVLSPQEERDLIRKYVAQSGDTGVEQRLFVHKLLAGLWAMNMSQARILYGSPGIANAKRDDHRRFMNAWDFLTVHTARHCGALCQRQVDPRWRAPLVVLDIDGVLDMRLFGFPGTTAAGMTAVSLLNSHGCCVALDTARSVSEVKDYCNAYSLAGGIAEHGSYLWDAVHQRERVLISAEAARQLDELRAHLGRIPGVFLDERHRYSIRAFTYQHRPPPRLLQSLLGSAPVSSVGDGAVGPISSHIVQHLLTELRLDQLKFHQTFLDTAIGAKHVDKGTGLVALREWVLAADAETIAVGDDEPDLAMFRVATRSFAPSNIACKPQARLHGCQIASHEFQRGLLEIVRKIVHPDNGSCERCGNGNGLAPFGDDLFLRVLQAADQKRTANLRSAMFHPAALKMLLK